MSDSTHPASNLNPATGSEAPLQEPQNTLAEVIDASAVAASVAGAATESDPTTHDTYEALRSRDFRLFLTGAFVAVFAQQMITVAIGWELYERTDAPLALGGVGLAQIAPVVLLFLPSGYLVDRNSRKLIFRSALAVVGVATLGLTVLSAVSGPLALVYGCLVIMGGAQALSGPASSALVAQVVPEHAFENATTWRSSATQLAAVLGPTAGGFGIALFGGATGVYALAAVAFIAVALALHLLHVDPVVRVRQATQGKRGYSVGAMLAGLKFLGQTRVLLAAITLDLFAVLLGGATTLLPIFARDILHVGPAGLGWLQAADSVGAVSMALILAHLPPFRHAGRTLLLAVAGFGLATIIFGLSHWFWLSLAMLVVLGAMDNISVVIRTTLALVRTPDALRGRVGAVNSLFIGTSNQLGGFESGLVGQLLGPVAAVALGGVGTILVVAAVAFIWPEMRNLGALRETATQSEPAP